MMRLFAIIVICQLVAGCTLWPDAGQGGMAELRPAHLADDDMSTQLAHRVMMAELALVDMQRIGLQQCLPGRSAQVSYALAGITRELHGGMPYDAALRLNELEFELTLLRCHLNSVSNKTGCEQSGSIMHHQGEWFDIPALLMCGEGSREAKVAEFSLMPDSIVVLSEALFDTDQYTIKPFFYPKLDTLVALLVKHPELVLEIIGHTDDRGGVGYNDVLSLRRAQRVADYFVQQGVEVTRIHIDAKGELLPRVSNATSEGRQLNRRVEIHLQPRGKL